MEGTSIFVGVLSVVGLFVRLAVHALDHVFGFKLADYDLLVVRLIRRISEVRLKILRSHLGVRKEFKNFHRALGDSAISSHCEDHRAEGPWQACCEDITINLAQDFLHVIV